MVAAMYYLLNAMPAEKTSFIRLTKSGNLTESVPDGEERRCIYLLEANETTPIDITQTYSVGTGSSLFLTIVMLGGSKVSYSLVSTIRGAGGASTIDWIFYGKEDEKQKISVRTVFDAKNGSGEIAIHGVAENRASVDVNGCIEITTNGGGTNTYLTEKTLMLDPTAKVNAVPGLEIKTNDVKASHSASVSKVSGEDLFYFASRGISEQEARRMYVEGFLGSLLERIPDIGMRQEIMGEIAKKYEQKR